MAKIKQQLSLSFLLVLLFAGCGSNKFLVGKKYYSQGEYFMAVKNIREGYPKIKSREEKAEAVYMLGKSYEKLGEYSKALPWLKNASRYNYPDEKLPVSLAEVLKATGKLDESAAMFGEILEKTPNHKKAMSGLKGIELTKAWLETPGLYQVNKMSRLNSAADEKSVSFYNRNSLLIATTREEVAGKTYNPVDGHKFADVFVSVYDSVYQKWSFPGSFEEILLNTDDGEDHIHISNDGKRLIITRAGNDTGKNHRMFYSIKHEGQWGDLKLIPFSADGFDYPHASWSADGEDIYFSSNRPGGIGSYDIWKARLNEARLFEDPVNLGGQINTTGDEIYPFERREGSLYFSSNFHMGSGAQDIFKARKERGQWQVANMGIPVNSHADDFGIQFPGEKEKGFFISNRKGSRKLDVYSFFLPPKLFMCFGKVFNEETDSVIENVNIRIAGSDGSTQRLVTNNGEFQAELLPDNEYTIIAYKKGFLNAQAKISTKKLNEAREFQLDFKQTPTDKPIRIDQIYYETGRWELLPSSKKSLDELIETLLINPGIQIEVSAHTDEVGEESFNMELSQKRANEVVKYLRSNGIPDERLIAKGYGEKRPFVVNAQVARNMEFLEQGEKLSPAFISKLNKNQQEIAKSLNRRTEFEVVGNEQITQ